MRSRSREKKGLCSYKSNKIEASSFIYSRFVFYESSNRIGEKRSSAPMSHSKLMWLQECHKTHSARQTGDRKTTGTQPCTLHLNARYGRKLWFRDPYESLLPARIQYRVSSPTERERPLSSFGQLSLPEEAPDETRSSREPHSRGLRRSPPMLTAQPGHTSAFMDVCGKEQDLAFWHHLSIS